MVSYLSSHIVLKLPDLQKHEILTTPALQEKATKDRNLVAIVLCIKELPKYSYLNKHLLLWLNEPPHHLSSFISCNDVVVDPLDLPGISIFNKPNTKNTPTYVFKIGWQNYL